MSRNRKEWHPKRVYRHGDRAHWAGWVWEYRGDAACAGIEPSWTAHIHAERGTGAPPPVWVRCCQAPKGWP